MFVEALHFLDNVITGSEPTLGGYQREGYSRNLGKQEDGIKRSDEQAKDVRHFNDRNKDEEEGFIEDREI